jgi:hypothetical protein
MLPWKVFIRAVGAVTLLTMGGLAAGGDVVPFSHVSRSVGMQAVVEEEAAPAVEADETPVVDDAAVPADDGSAVTEIPDSADPAGTDEVDPEPATPPVVEVTEAPGTPTTTAPEVDAPDTPPAAPAEDDAPVVCAAAAETACGPADPELAADARFDARVQRCEAWWNRLADRLEDRNRPRWAARARMVAERCEVIITRWQERKERREERRDDRQVRREERQDRREERKVKGDHNCDGRPDNGWHAKPGYPFPCDDAGRPETAPARVRRAERHSEGRR